MSPVQQRIVIDAVSAEMRGNTTTFVEMAARSYAHHLSAEDLNVMADFYESTAGQRYIAAIGPVQSEIAAVMSQWGQQVLGPRVVQRIQEMVRTPDRS